MKHTSDKRGFFGFFGFDTAIVLFFLAIEYGRAVRLFSADGILMAVTIGMVVVLPYFLPSRYQRPSFGNWMIGRSSILLTGLVFGAVFSSGLGVMLPASLRFMPMTFLILASMISCYVQFYGLMRLRLAK
jgi:hypothetical protein